jgi:hypothetical protein
LSVVPRPFQQNTGGKKLNVASKLRLMQLAPAILSLAIAMLLWAWGGGRADV